MSKRDELREKRRQVEKRTRIVWIGVIVVVALALVAVIAVPAAVNALTPVGEIQTVVPNARPQANGFSMGNPNAPVKVEEFADFQCPVCKDFTLQLEPTLIDNYIKTGKVYFTFTSWPFIGEESSAATEAAYCANDQGKFWDFHDILFANQGQENGGAFSNKRLVAYAQSLGLDMGKFNDCFNNHKFASQITQNQARAQQLGVTATPSFVINGQVVYMDKLTQTIDATLGTQK